MLSDSPDCAIREMTEAGVENVTTNEWQCQQIELQTRRSLTAKT
jgi:hypothetical protein